MPPVSVPRNACGGAHTRRALSIGTIGQRGWSPTPRDERLKRGLRAVSVPGTTVRSASSSARVLEPVAEEEVAAVQANGEELPAESARGKEARALDQPEVALECRAAGE